MQPVVWSYRSAKMRLSESRIANIVGKVVDSLIENQMIRIFGKRHDLERPIIRLLFQDLAIEDEIDEEVERILGSYSRNIEEGGQEWNVLFRKTKEEIATKRGYIY